MVRQAETAGLTAEALRGTSTVAGPETAVGSIRKRDSLVSGRHTRITVEALKARTGSPQALTDVE
jgi:hypothetical protein